jgi:hypothetical protein
MNRRVTALTACLIAAFAVTAVIAATSSASMTLPKFSGTDTEFTGEANTGVLIVEGGAKINCEAAGGETGGTVESNRHLGTGTIKFSKCTEGIKGEPCFSLGGVESTPNITVTGSWHLVLRTFGSTDFHYFLFLFGQIHIECPKAAVKLFLVSGDVDGLIAQAPGSTTRFNFTVKTVNAEGKVQEYSEFENEAGTGIKTSIEVSQEGGKAKKGFEESTLNTLIFPLATSIEG